MSSAALRGWGPGWPNCQQSKMVTITCAGGIRLMVRKEVAPIFKGFCDEIHNRGYLLNVGTPDDWGFACRAIRGTQIPSNHSWGLAIDINAVNNPMSSTLRTDMPSWVWQLAESKYGLYWGGHYKTRPDAMHYEFLGTPSSAAAIVNRLQGAVTPPPAPITPEASQVIWHIENTPYTFLQRDNGMVALNESEFWTLAGAGMPVKSVSNEQFVTANKLIRSLASRPLHA